MAIFNSIVIGKASGKIGNVVLCSLKGQNVAKSRNYSPTNPRTVLQTNSRGKMSNAVLAWQFLSLFLVNINALRKSTESNYNAFIRLSKNLFSGTVANSGCDAAAMLADLSVGISSFVLISDLTYAIDSVTATFSTGGLPFIAGSRLHYIGFNNTSGANVIIDHVITEAEWNLGIITFAFSRIGFDTIAAYVYNNQANKCSNILFAEV